MLVPSMRHSVVLHFYFVCTVCSLFILLLIGLHIYQELLPQNVEYIWWQTRASTRRSPMPTFEPNQCSHATCFDVAACAQLHPRYPPHRIRVHVYPLGRLHGSRRESAELISAIRTSRYFVDTPEAACLFVPDIDLLNGLDSHFGDALRVLLSDYRNYRRNFLLIFPSNELVESTATLNALISTDQVLTHSLSAPNILLLMNSEADEFHHRQAILSASEHDEPQVKTVNYVETLVESLFCVLLTDDMLALFDSLRFGCIPVLVGHRSVPLPFYEVLDWSRLAIQVDEARLPELSSFLASYTYAELHQFQHQISVIYNHYFSSVGRIALTVLDLINDRVFPMYARSYHAWNDPEYTREQTPVGPALFYPTRIPPQSQFTVLIRAHFYFAHLHRLLSHIQYAQGLQRIVVVWTNRDDPQPADILWPSLRVPLTVIVGEQARKFGHFYPFVQVKTDAVLSLDDFRCPPSLDDVARAFEHFLYAYDHLAGGQLQNLSNLLFDSFCEDLLMNTLIVWLSDSKPLVFSSSSSDRRDSRSGRDGYYGATCDQHPGGLCYRRIGNISHHLASWWSRFTTTQSNLSYTFRAV